MGRGGQIFRFQGMTMMVKFLLCWMKVLIKRTCTPLYWDTVNALVFVSTKCTRRGHYRLNSQSKPHTIVWSLVISTMPNLSYITAQSCLSPHSFCHITTQFYVSPPNFCYIPAQSLFITTYFLSPCIDVFINI